MTRTYEVMFIVRPDIEEADLDKLIEGFSTVITTGNGEVKQVEKLGRRRLAYTVRKFQDGQYILLHISADGPLVAELERRLRVTEQVIKVITVRTDEENKRLAKVKAKLDTKVKTRTQHSNVPPAPMQTQAEAPLPPAATDFITPDQPGTKEAPVDASLEVPAIAESAVAEPATV